MQGLYRRRRKRTEQFATRTFGFLHLYISGKNGGYAYVLVSAFTLRGGSLLICTNALIRKNGHDWLN
jgi:hypothetical protein